MTYEESLAYLTTRQSFGIKPGLDRITKLLNLLNNPQNNYRIVHIAGTNGKGSTAAMTANFLTAANITTGLFTSPHLIDYTERMKINGEDITPEEFADCIAAVAKIADAFGEDSPTQFEILTAAAFLFFARQNVEYAVIEAGMGGLLDSTNVVTPALTVITNVSIDHTAYCGSTIDEIARHKAGIIKAGCPVITAATERAAEIIAATAAEKEADVFSYGVDFSAEFTKHTDQTQVLSFTSALLGIKDLTYEISLMGLNQIENSATSLMCAAVLHNLDERITAQKAALAMKSARWPGRFECFSVGMQKIVFDGAHNAAGAKSLRENLDFYFPDMPRVFLIGILRDKEADIMLKTLLRPEDAAVTATPTSERALNAAELAALAKKYAGNVEVSPDNYTAIKRAMLIASSGRLLIAAGSLYLIGDLRRRFSSVLH